MFETPSSDYVNDELAPSALSLTTETRTKPGPGNRSIRVRTQRPVYEFAQPAGRGKVRPAHAEYPGQPDAGDLWQHTRSGGRVHAPQGFRRSSVLPPPLPGAGVAMK